MSRARDYIERIIASPIFYYFVILIFTAIFVFQPRLEFLKYNNIDPSFQFGFDFAALKHITFGSRFVSTYGPLGFLELSYLPQLIVQSTIWLIVYVALLASGVFVFMTTYQIFQNKKLKFTLTSFLLIYCLAIPELEWRFLALFILYEFIYLRLRKRKWVLLVGLSFFSSLFIFIKFSLGIAAIGSLTGLSVEGLLKKNKGVREVLLRITSTGLLVAIFTAILSGVLHVALFQYLKEGLIFTSKYSASMSWTYPGYRNGELILGVIFFVLLLWLLFYKKKLSVSLKKYSFLLVPIFVVWKNGVVRQDSIHFVMTLLFIVPIILMIYFAIDFQNNTQKKKGLVSKSLLIIALLFLLIVASVPIDKFNFSTDFLTPLFAPISSVKNVDFIKFFQFENQKKDWTAQTNAFLAIAKLPPNMRATIGNNTVDVFPWEASIIWANQLNWSNRPSPFSFETFDPYFDSLNANFMSSANAPKFIIWQNFAGVEGIDHRYILWDEPETLRSILDNYKSVSHDNNFILLEKTHALGPSSSRQYSQTTIAWDTWVKLPQTVYPEITLVSGNYKNDILIKMKDMLLRGEIVNIDLKYENGNIKTYRFVLANLSQGFMVNPAPLDWEALANLLEGNQDTDSKVTEFKFTSSPWYEKNSSSISTKLFINN